ncbi:MAG: ribosomal protein S18-alanine N-acetyltransferase [Anaerocolumna sp.]
MKEMDLPAVHEIECSIFSKPWSMADFKDSLQNSQNIYLVVEEQKETEERNEIIAYCGLWGVAGEGQINNVAVKKANRGQGIGHAMLTALIELGQKQGLAAFTLEVRVSNLSAIALYHKSGFLEAGVRKNFYEAPVEDALIMWLQ